MNNPLFVADWVLATTIVRRFEDSATGSNGNRPALKALFDAASRCASFLSKAPPRISKPVPFESETVVLLRALPLEVSDRGAVAGIQLSRDLHFLKSLKTISGRLVKYRQGVAVCSVSGFKLNELFLELNRLR
jgi:hypothetical protein